MVEATANGIEDKLIDGLSFSFEPRSILRHRPQKRDTPPSGFQRLPAGSGTKLIRILLTGDNWLDPSTLRVMFTLNNKETDSTKELRPLSGPWSFFRRTRI